MTYAVGSLMPKSIHSCPIACVIKHIQAMTNFENLYWTQRLCTRCTWNLQWMFTAMAHCSKPLTNFSLHRHFKYSLVTD